MYLARLFRGLHEPRPSFVTIMRDVAATNDVAQATRWLIEEKLPHIRSRRLNSRRIYLETSHLACKGFLVPLIELLGDGIRIIRLRRREQEVVASLKALGVTPPARSWYLCGTDELCVGRMSPAQWQAMSDEDRCVWYVREIEAQWQQRVKPLVPPHQLIEVDLESLVAPGPMLDELAEFVGLPYRTRVVGRRFNTKTAEKRSGSSALERITTWLRRGP